MKHKYLFLLSVLWICSTSMFAEYFRQIGLSEGLTQPSVMAIYQDRMGRMWFGTREGINVYNGDRLKTYKGWITSSDGASPVWLGNEIMCIEGDKEGNIFLLSDNDLIRYDLQTETFSRLTEGHQISVLSAYNGEIWFARHDSLFCNQPETGTPVFKLKVGNTSSISSLTVVAGNIYVGTHDGVVMIDRNTDFRRQILPGIEISRVFEDSRKGLWIGTRRNGLYTVDSHGEVLRIPYQPGSPAGVSSLQIRDFIEDNNHNIWFGTFDGLQKYNRKSRQFSLIQIPKYVGGLNHPSIFSLYKDVQGNIWVGSYFGGVNYFSPQRDRFIHYDYNDSSTNLYYSYIGDIILDRNNHLWLCTDGGGISCMDKEWNTIHQFTAGSGNALPHNNIKSICYDEKNECLYIGTYLGGLSRYDIHSGRFHNYYDAGKNTGDMPNEVVYHVKMWKDQLYLSSRSGIFRLDPQTDTFHRIISGDIFYETFDIDAEGNLYLVGWSSLTCLSLDKPDDITEISLAKEGCKGSITRIKATDEGVYIATLGSGLYFYNKSTHNISHYTCKPNQLPSDFCYNICQTKNGNILVTSDKGVTCIHPKNQSFSTINPMGDFPSARIISGCGIFATDENHIYVGDTKGVSTFTEDEFTHTGLYNDTSTFYFSDLWVNNQPVIAGDPTHILKEALPYTRKLTLRHNQNNIIICFALSDYEEQLSEKEFKYRLEGFDRQWIRTNQTELHYTNLDPGTYTLRVCAISNNNGKEVSFKEITLLLTISSPWYATGWAYLIYLAIITGCIAYYISSKIAKRTLALSLEKERFEKQQIERLNHEKLVFFTNVSHEFRTPLTLITSHIDILLQKHSLTPSLYNQILKIKRNAQQMTNLISELLEFRKLEQNYETLHVSQQNLTSFLQEIYFSFADNAHERNIRYEFRFPDPPVLCWFDARLMERVFFNLLSNAFKYTPDRGTIAMHGKVADGKIEISITDTGSGIPEHETERIFERFYQCDNNGTKEHSSSGTGIGLALSKSIIEKHHGQIRVESTLGKGSTFFVQLLQGTDAFKADPHIQLIDSNVEATIVPGSLPALAAAGSVPAEPYEVELPAEKTHTLLLVEDNEELLDILKELFAPFYHLLSAGNGKEGLEQVYENKPDLIISDIMMPEMSGTEMCLQIKNNIDLCHIPIILLTALNTTEQNIEGLNRGADDYITKPFNARLLLARANNLIRSRLLIQHQFDKKPLAEIDLTSINPLDKDLLKRTSQVIEQHINDTEFDIPELCRELGIGRSLLYTKFKALTGMTPNNFVLNYRLKYAAILLQQYPTIPIAEVSDRTGFNSPVYFSQCFKKQFGTTPQNYRKKNQEDVS